MQEGTNIIPDNLQVTGGVFDKNCPTRKILDHIGDKWSVLIMLVIGDRSLRFNEIKRSIEGISPKVLSNSLKNNERFGFILREVKSEKQIEVHYRLTKLGHEMIETIYPLIKWAELRMTSIDSCQNNYDNDSE